MSDLRVIPSIEQLRQRPAIRALEARVRRRRGRRRPARRRPTAMRTAIAGGDATARRRPRRGAEPDRIAAAATSSSGPSVRRSRPVINATGVVIHTNLGRAPLRRRRDRARSARSRAGYSTLEYDLGGRRPRGRRDVHAEATALPPDGRRGGGRRQQQRGGDAASCWRRWRPGARSSCRAASWSRSAAASACPT